MSMYDEFKTFIAKGNVIDLAIAVVVGGAFGEIVKALVSGIVMPLVSCVLPAKMVWEEWTLGKLRIGLVLGAALNFLIIAGVVFLVLVKLLGLMLRRREEAKAEPDTRTCPACLESVPRAATRCKFCTSTLEPLR